MAVVPGMTELTAPYWEAAREKRLVVQECRSCRQLWHPPLPRCPHCHAAGPGWRQVSGDGTIYTYTIVRHPTHYAFAGQVPYILAIVELAEGRAWSPRSPAPRRKRYAGASGSARSSVRSPTG